MFETQLPWGTSARFVKVICSLGLVIPDGTDVDRNADLTTQGGKVTIVCNATKVRLIPYGEPGRMLSLPSAPFTIAPATGELFDTQGVMGLYVLDPMSPDIDPQGFTYTATVVPNQGASWSVTFGGNTSLPDVVDLVRLASIAPATGVSTLEQRIEALESGAYPGGSPLGVSLWDEESLAYPARPAGATLVIWRGPADPRLIVGSGFVTNMDLWAVNAMDAEVPSAVTNMVATPAETSVALAWTAATDDIAVTGYEVRTGAGVWADNGADTSASVTGLTTNTAYTFGVRAYDAIGHKGPEVTVSTVTGVPRSAFTDFSTYTTDAAPSDWTQRWNTSGVTATVVADAGATGGKVLQLTNATSGRSFLSWDDIPSNESQMEIVARVKSSAAGAHPVRMHGSGAATSESGYFALFAVSGDQVIPHKYVAGVSTTLGGVTGIALSLNTYYWVRLRTEAGTLKMKAWADGASEPAGWGSANDTSLSSGWAGVGGFPVGTLTVDVFGAAWGGGTAPKVAS